MLDTEGPIEGEVLGYVIGIVIALLVSLMARVAGLDRDRAFYPFLLMVIASYYVLFAAMAGSVRAIETESIVMTLFVIVAIAGFKFNLWFVVAALAAHGVFDFFHGSMITNPGVPAWWRRHCCGASTVGAVTTYSDTHSRGYLPFSAPDAATTMFFTDDPIVPGPSPR